MTTKSDENRSFAGIFGVEPTDINANRFATVAGESLSLGSDALEWRGH